jgi:hypothetical protein
MAQQAILAAAMALISCVAGGIEGKATLPMEPRTVRLGESFSLRIGEAARIEDVDVTVTFQEVSGDSRCPKDVTCIQAGEAVVVLGMASTAGPSARLELAVPPGGASPAATFESLQVVVLELEPQPESTKSIDASTYQATLRVTRAS